MQLTLKMTMAAIAITMLIAAPISSAQTKTYKDPNTGGDCVREVDAKNDGYSMRYTYRNTCGSSFSISILLNGVRRYGGYVSAHSDREITVPLREVQSSEVEWLFE